MNRNDFLQWFILGFGQTGPDNDLGRETNILELWQEAKRLCFDCDKIEVLDALYTMPHEYATLIKFVPAGEDFHPVCFERVRNTVNWPAFFAEGYFSVKVLSEGKVHFKCLAEQLGDPLVTAATRVQALRQASSRTTAAH